MKKTLVGMLALVFTQIASADVLSCSQAATKQYFMSVKLEKVIPKADPGLANPNATSILAELNGQPLPSVVYGSRDSQLSVDFKAEDLKCDLKKTETGLAGKCKPGPMSLTQGADVTCSIQ